MVIYWNKWEIKAKKKVQHYENAVLLLQKRSIFPMEKQKKKNATLF
jgi:hypothetical protein